MEETNEFVKSFW